MDHIRILGIINLTDDSYYAQSRVSGGKALLERAARMVEEGADGIDLGACSTRPGARPVGAEVEWQRLAPAVEAIRTAFPKLLVSIDTYWSSVVERVFDRIGTFIVNDISAGAFDPLMLPAAGRLACRRLGLPYIAMHLRGTPETMQSLTEYPDGVTAEVLRYFQAFSSRAEHAGIRDWILDPGFGFAKTLEQNWTLLRELDRLQACGRPILVGISRKSMIYKKFGITPEEALPATQAAHLVALQKGARWLRVHDVAEARRTAEIYSMMNTSSPGAAK